MAANLGSSTSPWVRGVEAGAGVGAADGAFTAAVGGDAAGASGAGAGVTAADALGADAAGVGLVVGAEIAALGGAARVGDFLGVAGCATVLRAATVFLVTVEGLSAGLGLAGAFLAMVFLGAAVVGASGLAVVFLVSFLSSSTMGDHSPLDLPLAVG